MAPALALRDFLAQTPFFGGLVDTALDRVLAMLVERRFEARAVVLREGDSGRSMYIVRSGQLVVCKGGDLGHLVRLARLGPGDFFGEMTLIEMQPRGSTILVGDEPAVLYELTNADLYRLYQDDVHAYVMVLQNINRELCRRLRRADTRITEFAEESGDEHTQIPAPRGR
jgi:CRP-like cAMP-binding protein